MAEWPRGYRSSQLLQGGHCNLQVKWLSTAETPGRHWLFIFHPYRKLQMLLEGLQQKCNQLLQAWSASSAALKSKTYGRLCLKAAPLARAGVGALSSAYLRSLQPFPQPSALAACPWTARPGEVVSVLPSALPKDLMRILLSESCRDECSGSSGSPMGHEGQGQREHHKSSTWRNSRAPERQLWW